MKQTELKPLQVEDLINEVVTSALSGNLGIALVRFMRAHNVDRAEIKELNDKLNAIWLQARKDCKAAVQEFINEPVPNDTGLIYSSSSFSK